VHTTGPTGENRSLKFSSLFLKLFININPEGLARNPEGLAREGLTSEGVSVEGFTCERLADIPMSLLAQLYPRIS